MRSFNRTQWFYCQYSNAYPCLVRVICSLHLVISNCRRRRLYVLFQTFLISFHRFLVAIGSPWNDRLLQGKRKYAIYSLSWSVVLALHYALIRPYSENLDICNIQIVYGKNFKFFMGGYGITAMVLMLSTIILYLFTLNSVCKRYMRTYAWQIQNGGKATSATSSNKNTLYNTEAGKKKVFESLKVVGMIISLLVLLTGPFVVVVFMTLFRFEPSHSLIFITCLLSSINSIINPFIYSWKIESLRKEFKMLFQTCLSYWIQFTRFYERHIFTDFDCAFTCINIFKKWL